MNDLQKELDLAFKALSAIYVAGDDVERMVIAREKLRMAYKMAGTEQEESDG